MLEKTLESPLDCKEIKPVNPKGNQSWIFIGKTDAELKLQYFGHLMWRIDSLEKTLIAGGEGADRRWDAWMASATQGIRVWTSSSSWWWTGKPGVLQSMGLQRIGHDWVTELNWTGVGIQEWVAVSFFRISSWPRDWTCMSCIAGRLFTTEPQFLKCNSQQERCAGKPTNSRINVWKRTFDNGKSRKKNKCLLYK